MVPVTGTILIGPKKSLFKIYVKILFSPIIMSLIEIKWRTEMTRFLVFRSYQWMPLSILSVI